MRTDLRNEGSLRSKFSGSCRYRTHPWRVCCWPCAHLQTLCPASKVQHQNSHTFHGAIHLSRRCVHKFLFWGEIALVLDIFATYEFEAFLQHMLGLHFQMLKPKLVCGKPEQNYQLCVSSKLRILVVWFLLNDCFLERLTTKTQLFDFVGISRHLQL